MNKVKVQYFLYLKCIGISRCLSQNENASQQQMALIFKNGTLLIDKTSGILKIRKFALPKPRPSSTAIPNQNVLLGQKVSHSVQYARWNHKLEISLVQLEQKE